MKKLITILVVFLIQFAVWSQTYSIKYKSFSSSTDGNIEEAIEKWKNSTTESNFILLYNNGISWYGAIDKAPIITEDPENSNEQVVSTKRVVKVSVYKNHNEKLLFTDFGEIFARFGEINPIKEQNLTIYDWEIKDKTQKISGYNCKLATLTDDKGVKVVAWYTDQIPINDGPSRFSGLPGLILQLQYGEKFFYTATSIKKENDNIIIPKPEGNFMKPKEFDEYMSEMLKPRTITRPDGTVVRVSGGNN